MVTGTMSLDAAAIHRLQYELIRAEIAGSYQKRERIFETGLDAAHRVSLGVGFRRLYGTIKILSPENDAFG